MYVEHAIEELCGIRNGDRILTSMKDDRGECVHETNVVDDIGDSHLVHRNEREAPSRNRATDLRWMTWRSIISTCSCVVRAMM